MGNNRKNNQKTPSHERGRGMKFQCSCAPYDERYRHDLCDFCLVKALIIFLVLAILSFFLVKNTAPKTQEDYRRMDAARYELQSQWAKNCWAVGGIPSRSLLFFKRCDR